MGNKNNNNNNNNNKQLYTAENVWCIGVTYMYLFLFYNHYRFISVSGAATERLPWSLSFQVVFLKIKLSKNPIICGLLFSYKLIISHDFTKVISALIFEIDAKL